MKKFLVRFFTYLKWCYQGGYVCANMSQINYPDILSDKKVLITGGSDGIGFAIARKFIASGATVTITGRSIDKLNKASETIHSERLHIMQWDISETKSIKTQLRQAFDTMNGLDVVVNNAAFVAHYNPSEAFLDENLNTNIKAVYLMCKYSAELMKTENAEKGGIIINMSSLSSYAASVNPYCLAKRTVNGITEGFAKQYAPYNIVVNAIAPGYCDSSINKQDATHNAFCVAHANNRITTPTEIAELALFLCSGAANGIIGQTIVCDGGAML